MNIAVCEEYQGKGLGKRLLEHAKRTGKQLGYRILEIGTGNSSLKQLSLYQRCGFRIVGVEPDYFIRNYYEPIIENGLQCKDLIRMRLYL